MKVTSASNIKWTRERDIALLKQIVKEGAAAFIEKRKPTYRGES